MPPEILPPSTDGPHFDAHQFDGKPSYISSKSSLLDFSDAVRMHKQKRVNSPKKTKAPPWALDDSLLVKVVVAYMERRALYAKPGRGLLLKRLRNAEREILRHDIERVELLRQLCQRFVKERIPITGARRRS